MKFGEHLQQEIFPPWKLSYISYNVLKKDLKNKQLDHKWNETDEEEFINKLENELEKVHDFVSAKLSEVDARISYCERTIQTFIHNPASSSDENWALMEDALTEVLFDVNDLAKFTRLNYIGFQKIIKKHDKWTGLNLKQDFIPQLRNKPLDKQRFDVAIVFISALHDICKQRGKPPVTESPFIDSRSEISGSCDIQENTMTFWIHPDNITEVKSIILLHLSIDTQDSISQVYLDNEQFNSYTSLLQKDEHAESIRLAWIGPTLNTDVFAERCVYQGDDYDISKVLLSSHQVNKFIQSTLSPNELANQNLAQGKDPLIVQEEKTIATEIQKSIQENQLKPTCRVFYNRVVFQSNNNNNNNERIQIDNDVTFINEENVAGEIRRGPEDWRRLDVGIDYPFDHVEETDILRFPYAVLETKLNKETPPWLIRLLESHLVHEVPRFSKYLHGASYLFHDRIPLLPWWLSEMEIDIRKPRSTNFGLTRSKSFKPLIDGQYRRAMEAEQLRMDIVNDEAKVHRMQSTLVTKGDGPLDYGPLKKPKRKPQQDVEAGGELGEVVDFNQGDIHIEFDEKKPTMFVKDPNDPNGVIPIKKVKVEPKVFFSNERTFIAWLQFCALILSVALNLLNFGDDVSRIAGAIFIGLSAGIAIYALYQFEKRAWMINHRVVGRYDDIWGPVVLCVLLVGALIVNFYLRFR